MITVENLVKSYGGVKAVDDISFEVKKGQILGFLGPNGAGKTTTMKILTCYMPPSSGRVTIDGLDVIADSKAIRAKIGYLPENAPIYADMNVIDYLQFVAEVRKIDPMKISGAIKRVIDLCGLGAVIGKDIGELSKGYRQRVGLAQSMIHDPEILILDEPTTGLDPNQIIEIRNLIKEIGKEKTIIFSTHILQEVTATCDDVMIVNRGKLVARGTPAELQANAQGKGILNVEVKTTSKSVKTKLAEIYGVTKVEALDDAGKYQIETEKDTDAREAVFQCAVDNKWVLLGMSQHNTSMEDVFRELTV
ncbi:MAG: ATP-binding cassette domain-containing protein [Calditrichaeota bacterium]|nr:ATP-binding cassette domain-containing protein [Calditrichota bacterium]